MAVQSLEEQSLKEMCKLEFGKIDGLYHPSDKISVKEGNFYISCEYHSNLHSENNFNEQYETKTRILFGEINSLYSDVRAIIGLISVHPKIRGMGFGRKMVETVELVFRKRGWDKIDVEHVDNPDFWEHMGYKQRVQNIRGTKFELYTKSIA